MEKIKQWYESSLVNLNEYIASNEALDLHIETIDLSPEEIETEKYRLLRDLLMEEIYENTSLSKREIGKYFDLSTSGVSYALDRIDVKKKFVDEIMERFPNESCFLAASSEILDVFRQENLSSNLSSEKLGISEAAVEYAVTVALEVDRLPEEKYRVSEYDRMLIKFLYASTSLKRKEIINCVNPRLSLLILSDIIKETEFKHHIRLNTYPYHLDSLKFSADGSYVLGTDRKFVEQADQIRRRFLSENVKFQCLDLNLNPEMFKESRFSKETLNHICELLKRRLEDEKLHVQYYRSDEGIDFFI